MSVVLSIFQHHALSASRDLETLAQAANRVDPDTGHLGNDSVWQSTKEWPDLFLWIDDLHKTVGDVESFERGLERAVVNDSTVVESRMFLFEIFRAQ